MRKPRLMRLLPASLSARINALMILTLVVSQLVSYFSFLRGRDTFIENVIANYMSHCSAAVHRSLVFVAPARQRAVVRALSTRELDFRLAAGPGRLRSQWIECRTL